MRWFHSLTFKLFLLMSLCLLLTVTGVAWQHTSTFRDFLDRQMEDTTVARASEVARELDAQLAHWVSLGTLSTQRLASSEPADFELFLASLLSAAPELAGVHVLQGAAAKTVTLRIAPAADTGEAGARLKAELKRLNEAWLRKLDKRTLGRRINVGVHTLKDGTEVFALALRFKITGQAAPYWTIVNAGLARVRAALPADEMLSAWVIDDHRRSVLATNAVSGKAAPLDGPGLLRLRPDRSPFGFKAFTAADGRGMLGAYAAAPGFDLSVFVAQDAAGARVATLRTIVRTLIWAWIFFLAALMMSFLSSDGVTRNLRAVTDATQRIAGGDFTTALAVKGNDEVAVLSHAVNRMAVQIQNLLEAKVAAARQEKELETARLVQTTLFPRDGFRTPHLAVEARSFPASECGGDWWGHFRIDDEREYVFVADATGHGAAAALMTAIAYSTCKTLAITQLEQKGEPPPPDAILKVLNRTLFESGYGTNTMTFFAALVDMRRGVMTFANAGHNMPFIVPAAPDADERMQDGGNADGGAKRYNHFKIKSRGTPLGYAADSEYEISEMELKAGDKLMLYTDGLFECTDPQGKAWREKGLRKSITTHAQSDVKTFQERIVSDAFDHFGGKALDDDITLVVVEIAKDWQPGERPAGAGGQAA